MILIKDLYKSYGQHNVLNGLTLEINKGCIYGFLGKNGAGKTTTMNILSGVSGFDSGECVINGVKLNQNKRRNISGIGYLPETPGLYPYMTGEQYLYFTGGLKKLSHKELRKRTNEMLDLTGLLPARKRKIQSYSRGMKQRLGMASIMFHKPTLYLLDEPTSALDPEGRRAVLNILKYLKGQGNIVFLSTHILSDVEKTCDTIGILHNGKLLLEGSINEVLNNKSLENYRIIFNNIPSNKDIEGIRDIRGVNSVSANLKMVEVYVNKHFIINNLFNYLGSSQLEVIDFEKNKTTLENVFISSLND